MIITDNSAGTAASELAPIVKFHDAALSFGTRTLWQDVNISVNPGEFIAILGPNGAGKSTMLKTLLGQLPLTHGTAQVCGQLVKRGSQRIGYVPQQKSMSGIAPIRGYDLVKLGLTGHRWGVGFPSAARKRRITDVIHRVGADAFAHNPVATLSGGEQQRLRIAQALVNEPELLLCDEPLLSLDIASQKQIVELINDVRISLNLAVLFVTHEINPVLTIVDRVIYIAGGHAIAGTPDEVLQAEVLSELYGTRVDVIRERGRILVFANEERVDHAHNHDGM